MTKMNKICIFCVWFSRILRKFLIRMVDNYQFKHYMLGANIIKSLNYKMLLIIF